MAERITIAQEGNGEYIEKKSKFLALAKHVSSEAEANEVIASIKSKHWDAKHHVYAYVIGKNGEQQRSTDDGEPSGTAGRPVLEIIKGEGLTDTIIVVTRYFGGVLLGTGGLVRAYSKAAKLAAENAVKVRPIAAHKIGICCDYDMVGKIQNYLIQQEITIAEIEYKNSAVIYCLIPDKDLPRFNETLNQHFQQQINCLDLHEEHCLFEEISQESK